jgi:hypothetical protein
MSSSDEDELFTSVPSPGEDNLAPLRYRKTKSTYLDTSGEMGSARSLEKTPTNKAKNNGAGGPPPYRTFPDEVDRLPSLPDFSKGIKCGHLPALVRFGLEFITRNGQTTYRAPVPPTSDVNELEYISALHQCSSMAELRQDCSIHSDEIATFLKSRHGLCIAPDVVRRIILQDGLTADKDDDEDDRNDGVGGVMDLVELTSALIIPNLLRLRRKHMDKTQLSGAHSKAKKLLTSPRMAFGRDSSVVSNEDLPVLDNTDMLKDILALMLEDCTGDATPKPLDEELVRDLLNGYGEGALARDDQLVREMVDVARAGSSPSLEVQVGNEATPAAAFLDLSAFVEALTSDVSRKYDPGRENRRSTNFDDVWYHSINEEKGGGGRKFAKKSETEFRDEDEEANGVNSYITKLTEETLAETVQLCSKKKEEEVGVLPPQDMMSPRSAALGISSVSAALCKKIPLSVRRIFTGQAVDYTVDTFRTRFQVVFVWMAFAVFYFGYLFGTGGEGFQAEQCQKSDLLSTIICPLIGGIVSQILMICELIIFGTPFIVMGSVGNAIEGQETITRMLVTAALFLLYNVLFFSLTFKIPLWIQSPHTKTWVEQTAFALSLLITAQHIFHTAMLIFKKYRSKLPCLLDSSFFQWYFLSGNVLYEAKIKRSALFKVDQMLNNAYDVHLEVIRKKERRRTSTADDTFLSNFGQATNMFSKRDGLTVYVGGVGWAWKSIRKGSLFTQEGIWLSGRLMAGSVFQICVIFALPIVVSYLMPIIIDEIQKGWSDGNDGDADSYAAEQRARIAISTGSAFAFLVAINSTILYIPSVVATTMKFRRGVIPTLRSEDFLHRYRFALDQTTLLFGGMFWGLMISSILIGVLAGGFIYALMWDPTQRLVFGLVGNLFGLSIVLIVKIIIMQVIRFSHYKAFYRTKTLSANVVNISMECYAIGISIWFMLVRTIKIIIVAALYLGRTDTPLFSAGVGIFGPLEIDNWPTVTRKEILIHEAHRHPYIETLGYLYMMQLRYRDDGFAKRACSAWRLLFVLALMPWLHKFRDTARPDHFVGEKHRRKQSADGQAVSNAVSKLDVGDEILAELASVSESADEKPSLNAKPGANRFSRESMISPRWQNTSSADKSDSPGRKRFMRGSMLSPRWQENSSSTTKRSFGKPEERADFLRSEIARLQAELSIIEDPEGDLISE